MPVHRSAQQIDQYLLSHQWAYTVAKLAVSTVAEFFGGPWAAAGASATFDGSFTYEQTGNIWAARRAGGIDMAEAYANYVIGGVTAGNYAENVAAHAALGCVSSRVAGGSCGSGAISGAIGPAIGDRLNVAGDDFAALAENVAIHSLVGGLSSRLAGGSFSTGAETAAFAYLFNQLGHVQKTDYKLELVPDTPEMRAAYDRLQSLADTAAANVDATCGWKCNLPWIRGTLIHSEFEVLVTSLGPASGFTAEVSYKSGVVVPYGTAGSSRADVIFGPLAVPTAAYDLKTGWAYMSIGQAKAYGANLPAGTPFAIIRPTGR